MQACSYKPGAIEALDVLSLRFEGKPGQAGRVVGYRHTLHVGLG